MRLTLESALEQGAQLAQVAGRSTEVARRLSDAAAFLRRELDRPPPRASAPRWEHDMWRGARAILAALNDGAP